jgi:hypothetical protein
MSDRLTLKGWCDWLIRDLAYRAPELWPAAIEQWVATTVRDYSPPEEQLVVVVVWSDAVRVYSLPDPMDRPTARRFLRDLKRSMDSANAQFHLRSITSIQPRLVESRSPDERRGTDPQ